MDIVILGAGVVGLTLANLLARQSQHSVTILCPKIANDMRYSAITTATQNVLQYLGIWDAILKSAPGMYDKMYLYDSDTTANVTLNAAELGVSTLGYIVSNQVIVNELYANLDNVKIITGTAINIEQFSDHNKIYTENEVVECKLVVGADGANSWLRTTLGMDTFGWNYNHSAIIATVETKVPHNNTATQRFATAGPLAFLPLAQANLCSIVWSTHPEHAQKLMQMTYEDFANVLDVEAIHGTPVCFPLHMLHAKQYMLKRAVLVGDAAHVIHPLAGQGMNLGILDAATLAEFLADTRDPGNYAILRKYERLRKSHNLGMIGVMEFCKRAFGSDLSIVQGMRSVGMRAINRTALLRNFMAKVGMGVYGELPSCAKSYM